MWIYGTAQPRTPCHNVTLPRAYSCHITHTQIRVLRLAKLSRVLRAINLGKKHQDTGEDEYVIGDENTKKDGKQMHADHLKEQLTIMLTLKVCVEVVTTVIPLPYQHMYLSGVFDHPATVSRAAGAVVVAG